MRYLAGFPGEMSEGGQADGCGERFRWVLYLCVSGGVAEANEDGVQRGSSFVSFTWILDLYVLDQPIEVSMQE